MALTNAARVVFWAAATVAAFLIVLHYARLAALVSD